VKVKRFERGGASNRCKQEKNSTRQVKGKVWTLRNTHSRAENEINFRLARESHLRKPSGAPINNTLKMQIIIITALA
jgi:hypothetical protein